MGQVLTRLALALVVVLAPVSALARDACARAGDGHGFSLIVMTHASTNPREADDEVRRAIETLRASPYAKFGLDIRLAGELPKEACFVQSKDSLVPTLRCTAVVNAALARCGANHFELIVLSKEKFTSRAGVSLPSRSGAAFVSTASPNWPRELLHELGHTLGLRDERPSLAAKARSPALMPGPNCAANESDARRRWGDLIAKSEAGLHRGCAGHRDWVRPDAKTIMGFPNETIAFGATNTRYVQDAIRCCFTTDPMGCAEAARRNPELAACAR